MFPVVKTAMKDVVDAAEGKKGSDKTKEDA